MSKHNTTIDTSELRIGFGRHNGELYTRLPVGYLKWLVNENTDAGQIAEAELSRRGTVLDYQIEISGHAIDRASLSSIRGVWKADRNQGEGLHSWLHRVATEAFDGTDTALHKDIKFAFNVGLVYPTLKTVMYKGRLGGHGDE